MNVNPKETIIKTASGNTPREVPEFTTNSASKLVKITGILTSNLRIRKSTDIAYMAFFRPFREQSTDNLDKLLDCEKHS